jgi:hypothetical protein
VKPNEMIAAIQRGELDPKNLDLSDLIALSKAGYGGISELADDLPGVFMAGVKQANGGAHQHEIIAEDEWPEEQDEWPEEQDDRIGNQR